ncbi:MAG: signal peptidase I [Gemmatimonadota bacterium]|nr:signal peptidase I [Gemmatimonadota bacterium]
MEPTNDPVAAAESALLDGAVDDRAPVASPAAVPESAAVAEQHARRRTPATLRMLRGGWEWAKSIQLAIVLFLLVRAFFVEAFKIPSGSMESTLLVGDFLLVNKLLYGAEVPFTGKHLPRVRDPRRGDVVVFQWPEDPTKNFVKRLVGLPGDQVEMRHGDLFLNGTLQREWYAVRSDPEFDTGGEEFRWQRDFVAPGVDARGYNPSRNNWGPLVVPPAHFFTLGDNRDNSLDSRYWGFVPDSLLRGSPIFVYYSYAPDSDASLSWLTRVRWQRLGELIR